MPLREQIINYTSGGAQVLAGALALAGGSAAGGASVGAGAERIAGQVADDVSPPVQGPVHEQEHQMTPEIAAHRATQRPQERPMWDAIRKVGLAHRALRQRDFRRADLLLTEVLDAAARDAFSDAPGAG